MKVKDAIRLLEKKGWFLLATRGSHRQPEGATLMRYAVVIEKADANYSAYVPDLPGCIATGDTVAAVESEIRDAIRFHIEGLQADGIAVPEPTSIAEYVET
jgi:predicted RNase H-like HicB family nuclease